MVVKPVNSYSNPGYPTRPILDEHPEILRLVPQRWRANPVVLAALSSLLTLASGCKLLNHEGHYASHNASFVAPLFVHGEGRGSFGCKVMNPPVFLSEAEARQVIVEEAKKAGIKFKKDDSEVEGVFVQVGDEDNSKEKRPLTIDGIDTSKKIAYVYVANDRLKWDYESLGSVWGISSIKCAQNVVAKLKKSPPDQIVGTFYEPFAGPDKDGYYTDDQMRHFDRKALRAQVQDFVKWLKSQGVI